MVDGKTKLKCTPPTDTSIVLTSWHLSLSVRYFHFLVIVQKHVIKHKSCLWRCDNFRIPICFPKISPFLSQKEENF